jgi:starch synthase
MIHNGGADYHGRLPLNFYNEDLWPLFNLAPEHYFGFRDPHRPELLNLTMAAARHTSGGVITVSQPYARDLLTPAGGDGLEQVLATKRARVFGVSNGINRHEINNFLKLNLELSEEALGDPSELIAAKNRSKAKLQQRLGLTLNPQAALISFVGRLAEQKGLSLLSGYVNNCSRSTLEQILIGHPASQIVVAGPITPGDACAQAISDTLQYLRWRYPGRVAFISDYITHSTALEIISASQLFLMPSRFEPGGITQLEALAAGTLVVARNVGGISATISNYDQATGTGTGFLCDVYEPTAFANTVDWALKSCQNQEIYTSLVKQAINARHAWSDRAPAFAAVVQRIVLGEATQERLSFLDQQHALSQRCAVV